MKFKTLRFKRRGAIGLLLLDRPQKRNALSDAMVEEIGACIDALPAGVKALVLHGAASSKSLPKSHGRPWSLPSCCKSRRVMSRPTP